MSVVNNIENDLIGAKVPAIIQSRSTIYNYSTYIILLHANKIINRIVMTITPSALVY